ncbi:MAG: hypothetical protein R3344_11665, partial [Acidobacteriota bacterium]|nr:hypothetical protein [Acidobacteriota bacterium]
MSLRKIASVCAWFVLVVPVWAIAPKDPGTPDPRIVRRERAEVFSARIDPGAPTPAGLAAQEFLSRRPGEWTFLVDARTDKAVLVQGSGIAVIPGKGNTLDPAVMAGLALPDGDVTVESLVPLARAFIDANWALLGPRNGRIELDPVTSNVREKGRLASIYFTWYVGDVPVEDAGVFVRINHGNITQFGAPLIGRADVDPVPAVERDDAVAAVIEWARHDQETRLVDEPRLVIQPERAGDDLTYRLVWVVAYTVPDGIETWEGRVDAHSGEIVAFHDVNMYNRVKGGIYMISPFSSSETSVPLRDVTVFNGGNRPTNGAGEYN